MGAAFVIALREGLEGVLIVAILLAYLRQLGRADRFVWVLGGAFAGVAASLVAGAGVFVALGELEGTAEQLTEGIIALVAVGVLTWMIFWMRQQARTIGGELHGQVDKALASGALLGLASIAFVGVVREGLETALFLIAADSGAANTLIGGLPGLLVAVLVGFGIYRGSQMINLRAFFQVTGGLIILVAAGLFSKGVQGLQEAGAISTAREQVWNISGNPVFGHGEFFDFLKGLFGWSAAPSAEQLAVWVLFLAVASWFFYLDGRLPFLLRLPGRPEVAEAEVESDPAA